MVRKNLYVDDLKPEDVILLEDGKPREITLLEGGRTRRRTIPVEMILLFDTSGSVVDEGLLNPLAFKSTLIDQLPNVKLAVYGFNNTLRRFCRPTRDPDELTGVFRRAIDFRTGAQPRPDIIRLELPPKRKAWAPSWIFEAVTGCARDVTAQPGNVTRMMLVFSDGFATTDTRPEEGAALPRELGIPVYPVALGHSRITERAKQIQANGYNAGRDDRWRGRPPDPTAGARAKSKSSPAWAS